MEETMENEFDKNTSHEGSDIQTENLYAESENNKGTNNQYSDGNNISAQNQNSYGSDMVAQNQSSYGSDTGTQNQYSGNGNYQQNPYSPGLGGQNAPTYKAPDYSYTGNDTNHGYGNYQIHSGNNYGGYQNDSNNNYGGGMPNINHDDQRKKGSTKKKVLIVAASALAIILGAGAAIKGIDILIDSQQKESPLLTEREDSNSYMQQDKENTGSGSNTQENNNSLGQQNQGIGSTSMIGGNNGESDRYTIVSEIAEESMAAMVSIDCTATQTYHYFGGDYSQDSEGSGSGFILGENDQEIFIATNNHVVEGANKIEITFIDETKAEATTKGTDATADLAVVSVLKKDLKKATLSEIKIAVLGNSDDVRLGEMVVAIGNALGYGQSVTVGWISAKDRSVKISDTDTMVLLQTDAAINPGNSGGALLNISGQVIGIPSVKYADSTVEGMGFAIPISRALPILDELMKREVLKDSEKGYLGVNCLDVTSDANTLYGMPMGVYVFEVATNGAAKEAGVLVGDIITAINGVETTSKEALVEKVHSYRIGTEITLSVQRSHNGQYKEMEIKVKLKDQDSMDGLSDNNELSGSEDSGSGQDESGKDGQNDGNGERKYYDDSDDSYKDFYDFFSEYFN